MKSRVMLVGPRCSGKTTFLKRLHNYPFIKDYTPTQTNQEYKHKNVTYIDTTSSNHLNSKLLEDIDFILIFIDYSSISSLFMLKEYIDMADDNPYFIVASKSDKYKAFTSEDVIFFTHGKSIDFELDNTDSRTAFYIHSFFNNLEY